MQQLSRPVSGPAPGPDLTVSPATPGNLVADRRRSTVSLSANSSPHSTRPESDDETTFLEIRRKVQACELLSASTEKLLWKIKFNGHLTVVVNNGRVIKSGYEEGYFRRKSDLGGILFET